MVIPSDRNYQEILDHWAYLDDSPKRVNLALGALSVALGGSSLVAQGTGKAVLAVGAGMVDANSAVQNRDATQVAPNAVGAVAPKLGFFGSFFNFFRTLVGTTQKQSGPSNTGPNLEN